MQDWDICDRDKASQLFDRIKQKDQLYLDPISLSKGLTHGLNPIQQKDNLQKDNFQKEDTVFSSLDNNKLLPTLTKSAVHYSIQKQNLSKNDRNWSAIKPNHKCDNKIFQRRSNSEILIDPIENKRNIISMYNEYKQNKGSKYSYH